MRILIMHASAGNGHTRAALALAKVFASQLPDAVVTVSDILDFTASIFRNTYARGYLRVVRSAPELWGYMYALSDRKATVPWRRKVRSAFNEINTLTLRRFLRKTAPDLIVCTHFMPLEVLSQPGLRKICGAPLYCVVTDFAVHSLWLARGVAAYFVATDDAREHLIERGLSPERVRASGIPIDPVFSTGVSAAVARSALGLDPSLPVVLVMSGGFGVGPARDLLRSFEGREAPLQLVIVAGANEEMKADCERIARGLSIPSRVYGFVNNVHELVDAADVVVSKPGGLTSSELMAKGKPMVIVDPIPGQEQRNCEYLLEAGAATRLYEMNSAARKLCALVADREKLERLRRNALRVGRPHAAADIVTSIREDLSRAAHAGSNL